MNKLKKIQPGWEGKAKGMLKVLWEQGFLDVDNLKQHTVDGRKDAFGNIPHDTSLKYLLGNCTDFKEEELMLKISRSCLGSLYLLDTEASL